MRLSKHPPSSEVPLQPSSAIPQPDSHSALLLIDLQNDFFPGGALAVPGAERLIPLMNGYIQHFSRHGWSILATREWHPANHASFIEHQGPCPVHCVQGSRGAQFHSELVMPPGMMVISKGTGVNTNPRSAFDGTSLSDRLEDLLVRTVYILGLAPDQGIIQTVIEACQLGYKVVLLTDATRWTSRGPDETAAELKKLTDAGSWLATSRDIHSATTGQ